MRLVDADELRIKPEYMHDICGAVMIRLEDVARIITEMPTIDPQPQWIPVSERLPEIGEYVLCSQDNGDVGEGKLLDSGSWLICYDQICQGSYWVKAWMPLPERYKGE